MASTRSEDVDHGRIETRKRTIVNDFKHLKNTENWTRLKTIVKIESIREFKNSNKPTEMAVRYYIASFEATPEDFQKAIRSQCEIENKLHWLLDVVFSEDASRKRNVNAAQNFSILKKIALNLLKKDACAKTGVKSRRLKAAWSNAYLIKILNL
jgi:predicted transposase YbfD/YdcC